MDSDEAGDKKIIIATSIASFDFENQKNAIETWIEAGLDVISFNCTEEYEAVKNYFPNIRFNIVNRNGRHRFGKPYVFFDDIMEYFTNCSYEVCGIVNSDIYLFEFDKERIYFEALNSMVFGSRMEITSQNKLNGYVCYGGYDFFFFGREIASLYPKSDLCIGLPVWDHWIIFVPMISGIDIKEIMVPSAFHLKHNIKWRRDIADIFTKEVYDRYSEHMGKFEEFISRENKQINFEKIFNKYAKKLFPANRLSLKSILVVFKGSRESDSYKSILNQTYKNFRIVNEEDFEIDSVKEELIYFISEGNILDSSFLELMEYYIGAKDCAVCGIQVRISFSIFSENIYPFDFTKMEIYKDMIDEECILYKTDFYRLYGQDVTNIEYESCAFVGRGLVQKMDPYYYLNRKLKNCIGKKLCIFAAGGHTRKLLQEVDFSKHELLAIFDSNIAVDGTEIEGYRVFHKSRLNKFSFDYIIISSISFEEQIYKELQEYVESDKIIRIYSR